MDKNYFIQLFSKKIGRKDYIFRYLPCAILASIDPDVTLRGMEFLFGELLAGVLAVIVGIALIFYLILLVIQRVNDIGWSRWFALLALVPIVSVFLGIFLFLRKGMQNTGAPQNTARSIKGDAINSTLHDTN